MTNPAPIQYDEPKRNTAPNNHKKGQPVTTAQEYAETIAAEIRALETALDGPGRYWNPEEPAEDDDTDTEYRAALTALEYAHDIDPADIFATYANETILDIIYWMNLRARCDTRTEWLRTYGGPTCRIYFETDHDYAEIESTGDDNKTARVTVYTPTLASQVNDLAETATR